MHSIILKQIIKKFKYQFNRIIITGQILGLLPRGY
jgi:hypothetical protein